MGDRCERPFWVDFGRQRKAGTISFAATDHLGPVVRWGFAGPGKHLARTRPFPLQKRASPGTRTTQASSGALSDSRALGPLNASLQAFLRNLHTKINP